jgi:hypothetical protein
MRLLCSSLTTYFNNPYVDYRIGIISVHGLQRSLDRFVSAEENASLS